MELEYSFRYGTEKYNYYRRYERARVKIDARFYKFVAPIQN